MGPLLVVILGIIVGLICISWVQTRRHKKRAATEAAAQCALCGYRRAGLSDATACPECGELPDVALKRATRMSAGPVWWSWFGGAAVLTVIGAAGNARNDAWSSILTAGLVGMIPAIPGVIWAHLKRMRLTPAARWMLGIGTVSPVAALMGVVYAQRPGTFAQQAGMLASFAWLAAFPLGLVGTAIGASLATTVDRWQRRRM